jgi:hypothetical protein
MYLNFPAISVAIFLIVALAIWVLRLLRENAKNAKMLRENRDSRNRDHDRLTELRDAMKQSRELLMQAIRRSLVVLIFFGLSATVLAQPKASTIVTNGELTPDAHFHLLLIHEGDQQAAKVAALLRQPRGAMREWIAGCNVRLMQVSEPQVEHHADLLEKHRGQLPILAFVEAGASDGRGAVWCSAAGAEIPTSEERLASWLGTYFAANQQAAAEANYVPPRMNNNAPMQSSFPPGSPGYLPSLSSQSYFMPRNAAPARGRRPFFNPQLDVALPDTLNTAVGLNPQTLQVLVFIGIVAIICTILLASSPIIGATILGHAFTNHPSNRPESE